MIFRSPIANKDRSISMTELSLSAVVDVVPPQCGKKSTVEATLEQR